MNQIKATLEASRLCCCRLRYTCACRGTSKEHTLGCMHLPTLTLCSLSLKLTLIVFFPHQSKRNDKGRFIPGATGVQPIYYTLTQPVQFKYFLFFTLVLLLSSPLLSSSSDRTTTYSHLWPYLRDQAQEVNNFESTSAINAFVACLLSSSIDLYLQPLTRRCLKY